MQDGRVAYQPRSDSMASGAWRKRLVAAATTFTLVGIGMSGCGLFPDGQREPWRLQAEQACLSSGMVRTSEAVAPSGRIDGPGACGIDTPFRVAAFSGGYVSLNTRATLGCPIIPKTDTWLNEVVQPAAELVFGVRVAELRAGSYSCRPRNNQRGAKLSEHSFGNALDVMAFKLADGRVITVAKGWKGAPEEQEFLREAFVGACRYYTTVLGPGSDMFHYDHFHLDLARHDARGTRRVCRPSIKFTSRLDRPGADAPAYKGPPPASAVPAWRGSAAEPEAAPSEDFASEIDAENDPFSVEDSNAPLVPQRRPGPTLAAPAPLQQFRPEQYRQEQYRPQPQGEPFAEDRPVAPAQQRYEPAPRYEQAAPRYEPPAPQYRQPAALPAQRPSGFAPPGLVPQAPRPPAPVARGGPAYEAAPRFEPAPRYEPAPRAPQAYSPSGKGDRLAPVGGGYTSAPMPLGGPAPGLY